MLSAHIKGGRPALLALFARDSLLPVKRFLLSRGDEREFFLGMGKSIDPMWDWAKLGATTGSWPLPLLIDCDSAVHWVAVHVIQFFPSVSVDGKP